MQESKFIKNQITLKISAKAVVAFGFWSILKTILTFWIDEAYKQKIREIIQTDLPWLTEYSEYFMDIMIFIVIIIVAIDLILRIYVGRSALKEAAGEDRKPVYIILAMIFGIVSLIGVLSFLPESADFDTNGGIGALLVEITSFMATLDLIISAIRVRKYKKEGR